MSVHIDTNNRLQHDQEHNLALTCPHCQVLSHITPVAVPPFAALSALKPKHVGIVYRCDACNEPVFLRFTAKVYAANRIEFSSHFVEIERAREKFSLTYLPEGVEVLFKEALNCYTAGCLNAFASMCRRVALAVFADLGEAGKLQIYDQLNEVRDMAEVDSATFSDIKTILFSRDSDTQSTMPQPDAYQAGVLLEVMKDLLYQVYIRKGRFQQAMMVRRFFVDEAASNKVTPISAISSINRNGA
jgi:hypothetical protein